MMRLNGVIKPLAEGELSPEDTRRLVIDCQARLRPISGVSLLRSAI